MSAQNPLYADVAVIVNDSSAASVAIGSYFAQQRGIPASRVLHVAVPPVTTVDSLGFEELRAQVEAELIGGNLLDTVNYLVTTKGLPARVSIRNGCDSNYVQAPQAINRCSCLESEMALILGPNAADILKPFGSPNPYVMANAPFSRDSFGIFLVSRLDGYTEQEAKSLVDHGGPGRNFFQPEVEVLLDNAGFLPGNPSLQFFQQVHDMLEDSLSAVGYSVFNDTSGSSIVSNRQDLIAYVAGWATDSLNGYDPNLSFAPGSIVHLWYNTAPIETDRPWTYEPGDAIADGAAVITTYTSVGFAGPNFQPHAIVPNYLDTLSTGFRPNAAEAAYRTNALLSQQGILYGDPKTSLARSPIMSIEDPDGPAEFALWPNPATGDAQVRMQGTHSGNATITVTDLQGRQVMSDTWNSMESYSIDCDSWKSGLYLVQVTQGKTSLTRKLSIVH
ncbi:MAG: TIGR03790 family protein [Bacteroidia bacterium]